VVSRSTPGSDWSVGGGAAFSRFAFKALPVCGSEGLLFSGHLFRQDDVFEQAWAVYGEAFTGAERRTRHEQARVMDHPRYRFSAIMHAGAVVGVLAWWRLSGFCFVEHFAIAKAHRSGGFGGRAMALLQEHEAGPVLVDVEPFETDCAAARRVAFYRRLGFAYCGQPVTLPPYDGKPETPSNFMAWGMDLEREGRARALETVCREVYGRPAAVPSAS
jgi:ribosomal protein S18 acetylase RimI-like enzyme